MTLKYLFGNESAIRYMARQQNAIWIGAVLVLTSGIAREYDQTYIFVKPFVFLAPFLISLLASGFIYVFVVLLNRPRPPAASTLPDPPTKWITFRTFLALFWMMAPLAWLYAIPFERYLGRAESASANIALLSIIAIWRVVLLSRITAILSNTPFLRSLFSVLLPCSMLLFIASIFTSFSLIRGMGGMEYSPEDVVIHHAAGVAFLGSIVAGLVSFIGLFLAKRGAPPPSAMPLASKPLPFLSMACILTFWCAITVAPQRELGLNHTASLLCNSQKYKKLLAFLSQQAPEAFSPVHRLPPDPYEYSGLQHLPEIVGAMDGSEKSWVREHYLDDLIVVLDHASYWYSDPNQVRLLNISMALERIPEGRRWALIHKETLQKAATALDESTESPALVDSFFRLGVVEKASKP